MVGSAFLTDADFIALADSGTPVVEPFDVNFVRPASIDLRLGDRVYNYRFERYTFGQVISEDDLNYERFEILDLKPNQSVFVGLEEQISIPETCLGFVFPRSSITRLGLIIQPVYMNPGYRGLMPLTIMNSAAFTVQIMPRVHIAQLLCAALTSAPNRSYALSKMAKYQDEEVWPSRLHTDAEIREALDRVIDQTFPRELLDAR